MPKMRCPISRDQYPTADIFTFFHSFFFLFISYFSSYSCEVISTQEPLLSEYFQSNYCAINRKYLKSCSSSSHTLVIITGILSSSPCQENFKHTKTQVHTHTHKTTNFYKSRSMKALCLPLRILIRLWKFVSLEVWLLKYVYFYISNIDK